MLGIIYSACIKCIKGSPKPKSAIVGINDKYIAHCTIKMMISTFYVDEGFLQVGCQIIKVMPAKI